MTFHMDHLHFPPGKAGEESETGMQVSCENSGYMKKKKNNYFCLVSSGVKNEEDKKTSKKPKLGNSTKFLNSALQQHPGMKSREARFPAIAWGGGGAKTTRAWAGSWDRERASVGKPGKHKETYSLVDW